VTSAGSRVRAAGRALPDVGRERVWGAAAARPLTRTLDGLVDVAIVVFAVFTVAYHVALLFDLTIATTIGLWLVASAAVFAGAFVWRHRRTGTAVDDDPGDTDIDVEPLPSATVAALVVGALAALWMGTTLLDDARWWLVDLAAVAALLFAVRAVLWGRAQPGGGSRPPLAPVIALVVAIAFALAALLTVRPDADDVLVVNRSVWIEQRGDHFPERDTLFSNQRFSYTRPENPSPAIEPLVGVVARLTPLSAPTVAYFYVAPAVSFLAVLALWRLLRALRATLPWLALVVGSVFLAFGGDIHTSFGNFAFGRAWQGKAIVVFLAVPLLWRHALVWSRTQRPRTLALLVATNVAAVGMSTTALFVAPVVTLLGVVAGLRRERAGPVLAGAAAAIAYPVGGALFTLAADRQPIELALAAGGFLAQVGRAAPVDIEGGIDPWDPWYFVLGTGATAVVVGLAVLCGWIGTRERTARLALVLGPLALFGLLVLPPVLHLLDDASGAGDSVLWRVVWVLPVPAMIGVFATGVLARFGPRAASVGALVVLALLVVAGTPIWSRENGARLSWHPEWDVDADAQQAADRLLSLSQRGDVVAAPDPVAGAIAIQTVDVRTVNPRGSYLRGRHSRNPAFQRAQRELVSRGMTVGFTPEETPSFVASLDVLSVDVACTEPGLEQGPTGEGLRQAGFAEVDRDDVCVYWRRGRA
jgi:hypothetical protein